MIAKTHKPKADAPAEARDEETPTQLRKRAHAREWDAIEAATGEGNAPRGIIVEKTMIDLKTGERQNLHALCTSEPTDKSTRYSLTFEGYITDWTQDRNGLEVA